MNRSFSSGIVCAALVLSAALLSGCASFDAAKARRDQTDAFVGTLQELADAHLAKPLSLDDCIRVAMTNNYDVRSAELDRQLGKLARDLSFTAFLPQFINPRANVAPQMLVLACTFVVMAVINSTLYAYFAASARRLFASSKAQRKFTLASGSLLSAAGIWVLLARRPA